VSRGVIESGGAPGRAQAAAIAAAVEAVLAQAAPVDDARPAAYRSAWRRAAALAGMRRAVARSSEWGSR
jgi:hypothetical protein